MAQSDKLSVKSYRGTRDFYPEDMQLRNHIFRTMRGVAELYGYEEYDGPMLESFDLYAAKSGEELVNEQLYHFIDRGNRNVAIRPEMTPTVARMVAARMGELPRPIRWFSFPNLWRYEKPQRGRLREHWQFNIDLLGSDSVSADQEIIEVAMKIMFNFGADKNDFCIHLSNRRILIYFLESVLKLDPSKSGPVCRVIDKRAKISDDVFHQMLLDTGLTSSQIADINAYLNLTETNISEHPVSKSEGFDELRQLLDGLAEAGLDSMCKIDMSIVRGLDYYTGTVFEMYDLSPENRRALFGGGRYDNLVGLFSKERISGVGLGMGDVTVADFLHTHNLVPSLVPTAAVHVALFDENSRHDAFRLASTLRSAGIKTTMQLEPVKLGKQFKWADNRDIPLVILQGPVEKDEHTVQIKEMASRNQIVVQENELVPKIRQLLNLDI
jgi:histidyl-tRNA synthetase